MAWPYTKRADGLISVTLDNNVWDFLFENKIDLARRFPKDYFALFITREVEIETAAIPLAKRLFHDYILHSIETANIQTSCTLGFDTGEIPCRRGSFGEGTFQSPLEAEIHEGMRRFLRTIPRPNGLYKNEGDISVAVASFFSIVLTMERADNSGPLQFARQNGGQVLHLLHLPDGPIQLRQYVENLYAQI